MKRAAGVKAMKEAGLDPKDKRRLLRTDDLAQALQEVRAEHFPCASHCTSPGCIAATDRSRCTSQGNLYVSPSGQQRTGTAICYLQNASPPVETQVQIVCC